MMNYRVFATSGVKHVTCDCHKLGPKDHIFLRSTTDLCCKGEGVGGSAQVFLVKSKMSQPKWTVFWVFKTVRMCSW